MKIQTVNSVTEDLPFEGFSGLHDYQSQTSKVQYALVISKGDSEKFFKLLKEEQPLLVDAYFDNLHSSQTELKDRINEDKKKYPNRIAKMDKLMTVITTTGSFDEAKQSLKELCALLKKP